MSLRITYAPDHRSLSPGELVSRIEETLKLLQTHEGGERLQEFALLLRDHVPLSYLSLLSPSSMAEWIDRLFGFVDMRTEEIAIGFFPLDAGKRLLVANLPDAPYLLESVQSFLESKGCGYRLVCHPIFGVRRQGGRILQVAPPSGHDGRESLLVFEIDAGGIHHAPRFEEGLRKILRDVLNVRRDRAPLLAMFDELVAKSESAGEEDFLRWLRGEGFHPLSYRCLEVASSPGGLSVWEREGARLGLSPYPEEPSFVRERSLKDLPSHLVERLARQDRIVVERTDRISSILRPENLVCIAVRESNDGGYLDHEFHGLFRRQGLEKPAFDIPPLRRRIEEAFEEAGISPDTYDWRKTVALFNDFPKPELFCMGKDDLLGIIRSFTLGYRTEGAKVFPVPSPSLRSVTLHALMPRAYYSAEAMKRTEHFLRRFFRGCEVEQRLAHLSEETLNLHVRVRPSSDELHLDLQKLEAGMTRVARPWGLRLRALLICSHGEDEGMRLWRRYADAFPGEYRALVHPRFALRDIVHIEDLLRTGEEIFDLWGGGRPGGRCRILFYSRKAAHLNELMPFMENLALTVTDEVDFVIPVDGEKVFIKSFGILGGTAGPEGEGLHSLRNNLMESLSALRGGELENDYLNRLILPTGLRWREIDIFRGYRNYYFQIGSPYTKKRVAFALINNPRVAHLLFRYFEARFRVDPLWEDPLRREEEALFPLRRNILAALEKVTDINEDDILRSLFNLVDSTVRTNFFLRLDRPDYFFSFKISAIGIIDMPAPRPLYEIYVHSATMEGIHLRGGTVARGGIRWSDRPDDFRTEILGLMKTQMTKNALIVPVGSKGGFVVKTPFAGREEGARLSEAAYRTLMRGLLDLTDNRIGDKVHRPEGIVAYDDDDPYLVVAADKGTAHLSDTANAVAKEYAFWLGDAFASGGSHGYDHKKLGITARGAWECVKAHFREMGIDIQSDPLTVVGIGDMSGDVFGNGMLLSRKIRLLAAFDHRHIFLDPDPDPEVSYRERRRLFDLPRSSWEDYDKSLISKGGGVFPRSSKEIPLSTELRALLGVRHDSIDGPGLVRLILTAPIDLLWNGGIGTYVKASFEKNEDVGDRANDTVRVDASQLRARVVGEGGNLGFTQKGRIEYALAGGRINTDAVDNSGGVDCSDHEVNIKIFLDHLLSSGVIASRDERDALIEGLAGDVCAMVLADNYAQSLCLSLDLTRVYRDQSPFVELTERLTRGGLLDRRGESLPSEKELLARGEKGLTRPELAILMAYAKMDLYQSLLKSDLPDRSDVSDYLRSYFPEALRNRFSDTLPGHPLGREILSTVITNVVVNQAGSSFFHTIARRTGAPLVEVVTDYLFFDDLLGGAGLRRELYTLDNVLPAQEKIRHLLRHEDILADFCIRARRHGVVEGSSIRDAARLKADLEAYTKKLVTLISEDDWNDCRNNRALLLEGGLPDESAERLAVLDFLGDFLPVVVIGAETGKDLFVVAQTLVEIRNALDTAEIEGKMADVRGRTPWDLQAFSALTEKFSSILFEMTLKVLTEGESNLDVFLASRRRKLNRYFGLRDALKVDSPTNYHPFTVILGAMEDILR